MRKCLICESRIEPFMSFGRMPIANGFLTEAQFSDEYFFDLEVGFCPSCTMVQLTNLVQPDKLFHENYAFYSSTSVRMAQHFQRFAERVRADYLREADPFVVEIGSNDGIMLRHFAAEGGRHLGIEPSANVAQVARERGVRTVSEFFERELAQSIAAEYGQADAMLAANVMCHIPDLHSVAAGIKLLLKPDGVVLFEDPYLGDVVERTSYDQMYDEHVFYFSVSSITVLFERHGLEVIGVEPREVHGGSMRYILAHAGARPVAPEVAAYRQRERAFGLDRIETYRALRDRIERSRDRLVALLGDLKSQGKRVVGYGATSKSTTVINYCRLSPDLVEFISDTTPIKQGKFSPGMHIPVREYAAFTSQYPEYALLFAWNHADEIRAKEQAFLDGGGRFVVYVPEVGVLGQGRQ